MPTYGNLSQLRDLIDDAIATLQQDPSSIDFTVAENDWAMEWVMQVDPLTGSVCILVENRVSPKIVR